MLILYGANNIIITTFCPMKVTYNSYKSGEPVALVLNTGTVSVGIGVGAGDKLRR